MNVYGRKIRATLLTCALLGATIWMTAGCGRSAPPDSGPEDAPRTGMSHHGDAHGGVENFDVYADGATVYLLLAEARPQTPALSVLRSTDGGRTWSSPRRLSHAGADARRPRVLSTPAGFRAFWIETPEGQTAVWATGIL